MNYKERNDLLFFLLARALAAQDPFALAMHVSFVLEGNARQMAEDVLLWQC